MHLLAVLAIYGRDCRSNLWKSASQWPIPARCNMHPGNYHLVDHRAIDNCLYTDYWILLSYTYFPIAYSELFFFHNHMQVQCYDSQKSDRALFHSTHLVVLAWNRCAAPDSALFRVQMASLPQRQQLTMEETRLNYRNPQKKTCRTCFQDDSSMVLQQKIIAGFPLFGI